MKLIITTTIIIIIIIIAVIIILTITIVINRIKEDAIYVGHGDFATFQFV